MQQSIDYYAILGISRDATEEEIKHAFRELARIHHPDYGGKTETFRKILEAYNTLSDSKERAVYDKMHFGEPRESTNSNGKKCVFDVYVYTIDTAEETIERIMIDTARFPENKYATNGVYYAFRVTEDGSEKILIATMDRWYRVIFEAKQESDQDKKSSVRNHSRVKESRKEWRLIVVSAIVIIVPLMFLFCFLSYNDSSDRSSDYSSSHYSDSPNTSFDSLAKLNSLVEYPLPKHGDIYYDYGEGSDTSFFTIKLDKNDTHYYYIKLESVSNGSTVQTVFMHPGKSITVRVPIGRYRLKYACGSTWYGYKDTFGPFGGYSTSDDLMEFSADEYSEYGMEVTLYPVINGNMETEDINYEDF